jgi:hypothetical protein
VQAFAQISGHSAGLILVSAKCVTPVCAKLSQRAENFIETPAFEVAPELLTSRRTGAMMGELIGHYRIEQLIGVGGMGEIEP